MGESIPQNNVLTRNALDFNFHCIS